MKCPKCGYVSHDYLNACRKCNVDLLGFKAQMQLYAVQAGNIDLRSVLGDVQPSPMASGEFDMGESLFDSPMLVEAQAEDGFDISLDDDFSFTPSGMSLESLDGFELSNVESMNPEQQRPAEIDSPGTELPDTGFATVMMDISGANNEEPPLPSAGDMFDAPMDLAGPELGAPIDESEEAIMELPDLPLDDALIEPDLASAQLRSSVGRTSDLDLTSMELKRTTRDIEMMNQLQNEALSGDTVLPQFDAPAANEETAEPMMPGLYSSDESGAVIDGLAPSDTEELAVSETDQPFTSPDDTASPFTPTLPESFPEEADGTDALNEESGELVLPSFDTEVLNIAGIQQGVNAADNPETSFSLPALPDHSTDEKPVNPFTEEISLAIDPLADPEPLPMDFPSLQTGVFPGPGPEETTSIDESSATAPPATEDDATGSPDTGFTTMELELGDPDSPQPDDAFLTATPEEATLADEPPPPLPVEPVVEPEAVASSDTGYATIELDVGDSQSSEVPAEAPVFPDLPEHTDTLQIPLPDDATIVDEPSPFASTDRPSADPADASSATGYTTIELDISDIHSSNESSAGHPAPGESAFPDLPKHTDAFLIPAPDEATIVDEPSPFASTGHTPIDFTSAPPDAGLATIELNSGDTQPPQPPAGELAFPDLPEPSDALLPPSPDEATIVDEPSPFASAGHMPADATLRPPEPEADTLDDDLDLELLFPDAQLPQKRD